MTCKHCDDTGSLSKELYGLLDCAHCDVADERHKFNTWARDLVREHDPIVCLWLAYQRGKQSVL